MYIDVPTPITKLDLIVDDFVAIFIMNRKTNLSLYQFILLYIIIL